MLRSFGISAIHMRMNPIVQNVLLLFAYGIAAALTMGIGLIILTKIWDKFTPFDEWKELQSGNLAVAIVTAAVIISLAIVVAAAIQPG